jgi:hypothetical protein
VLSRAALRRLVPLVAAGAALACAMVPASAHEGQDDRPGAAQMDLEVLITPPITGETSPGGQQPAIAVDTSGNVVASALKEDPQPLTVDQRAPAKVRAGSWRWQSGDDGQSFTNVSARPGQADSLIPGGTSVAAAADDRGRGYLLESYQGAGVLTVTRSTEKDDVVAEDVHPLPAGAVLASTRLAAHGDGRLFLVAAARTGPGHAAVGRTSASVGVTPALYRSDDAGASLADVEGSVLDGADVCDVAAGHARGSKQVLVACTMTDGTVAAFTSHDDGATLRKTAVTGTGSWGRPAVAVGDDGSLSVLAATTADAARSSMLLRRSRDGGRTWTSQELAVERGVWAGAALAVNKRGRLAVAAYHRAAPAVGWHVRLATFDAARRPVYVDFANHDPVTPKGWSSPPDVAPALAAGPDSRFHLLWTSVKVTPPADTGTQTSLLRNVWSVRTLST